MAKISDILGTVQGFFRIGLSSGIRLKLVSGGLVVRTGSDSADAPVTASTVNVSGDAIVLNSDAEGTGNDRTMTLQRPATMAADVTITLPNPGSPGQVLAFTDSSGTIGAVSVGGTADKVTTDTTSIAFGTTSPLALFTLPANAVLQQARIIVDTPFNGSPSISIGISGTTSKYVASNQVDLSFPAGSIFEINPGLPANASTEALIATYAAGGATSGAGRIEIDYAVPA